MNYCIWGKDIPLFFSFLLFPSVLTCSLRVCLKEKYGIHSHAAAAKSPQSCPTLCDTMDSSPPGSSVHGVLQARILEWVAIFFSHPQPYCMIKEESNIYAFDKYSIRKSILCSAWHCACDFFLKLLICLLYKCQNHTVTCDGAARACFSSLHVVIFICTFLKYWGTEKAICFVSFSHCTVPSDDCSYFLGFILPFLQITSLSTLRSQAFS